MSAAAEKLASRRRWRRVGLAALLALLAATAWMHQQVLAAGDGHVVAAADAPLADLIVVPGARIHPDGTPYTMLAERLDTALDLFRLGRAPQLLLSGKGGGAIDEDEVAAMRRWLAARGVPEAAMVDDPLGLRTVDTLRRCRDVYAAHAVIVVTNPFHVARAVFLGRQCGLETTGVAAPYAADYGTLTMLKQNGREVFARIWAWLDVHVLGACGGRAA